MDDLNENTKNDYKELRFIDSNEDQNPGKEVEIKNEGEDPLLKNEEEIKNEVEINIKEDDKNEKEKLDTPIGSNNNNDIKKEDDLVIERPYYERNEPKKEEQEKFCCPALRKFAECAKGCKRYITFDDLAYAFFIFGGQFILIFLFCLFGFIYDIYKAFIETDLSFKLTFYITSFVVLFMTFTFLCFDENFFFVHIIYLIIYIPCISFFCFLLSYYTDYIYILCGLISYIFDSLSLIISFTIFGGNIFFFILFSSAFTVVILLIFHYKWIGDGLITFKISTVGLSEIIYLSLVVWLSKEKLDNLILEALACDLAIFSPFALYILGQCCA